MSALNIGSTIMKIVRIILALASFNANWCWAESLPELPYKKHPWNKYVHLFRQDHNFAFSAGTAQGTWNIKHFGNIEGKEFQSKAYLLKGQYSFHIPLWKRLGYFLGSSFGYYFESPSSEDFSPTTSLNLPGLLLGLSYNISPSLRVMGAVDTYLERLEGLKDRTDSANPLILDATMLTLADAMLMSDYFFNLNFALRIEWHMRKILYSGPKRPNSALIERAKFEKEDHWFGIGVVYHHL